MSDTNVTTQARCIEIRDCSKDEPLTKRERFAMAAMHGYCSNPQFHDWGFGGLAKNARQQADRLIRELDENPAP